MYSAIADTGLYRMREFCDQEVANLVWGFVRASVTGMPQSEVSIEFLAVLSDVIAHRACMFMSQQLSMVSWAFAKASCIPREKQVALLCSVSGACSPDRLRRWKPQEMTSVIWSFAKSNLLEEYIVQKASRSIMMESMRRNFASFKGQDFSNLCWSLSVLDIMDVEFIEALTPVVISKMNRFKPYELSSVCAAVTQNLADYASSFIKTVHDDMVGSYLNVTSAQTVSNFAFAFVKYRIVKTFFSYQRD